MVYYNLKLTLRNIWRHKTFSFINIVGLTVGVTCCLLLGLYAYNELSFDKFHSGHNNIYRINKVTSEKSKPSQLHSITPGKLAPAIRTSIPEVEYATVFRPWFSEMLVSYDTVRFKLSDVTYADEGFLNVFDFPLIKGNRETVLSEPFTAVVSESVAKKYFHTENPVGKTLTTLNNIDVKITGVCKDVPENSSIRFTMLISWATTLTQANADYFSWMNNWNTQVNYSFVKLKANSDPLKVSEKITRLLHTNLPNRAAEYNPYLQPLDKIHLYSSDILFGESFSTNSSKIVFSLLGIAAIILLIACFNFINLTTAGALGRAKETGVQKVLGANKGLLIRKFFGESFALCTLAILLSLLVVLLLLPFFNRLADTNIDANILFKPEIIIGLVGLLIVVSILAGMYPAIFLARFRSTDIFRNIVKAGKGVWVRKSLVTTQFALSLLLIVGTMVVQRQTRFMMTKDLGFDKEQVLVLHIANTGLENKTKELVAALHQYPGIGHISVTNRVPGHTFNSYGIIPEEHTADEHIEADVLETDTEFPGTYNISMIEGRYFSPEMPTDTTDAVVINESMVKFLNWKDPIGKNFEIEGVRKAKVIGVIKDINTSSLREVVSPTAMILKSNPAYVSLKLKAGNTKASLAFIQETWKQLETTYPYDYFFLDEQLNKFYKSDIRLLNVLSLFAVIAICIACLGLFGLSMYATRQRTKEIGIRKVLGASVTGVTALLSKDFLQLVFLAILIAFPIAWLLMNKWLEDFAYRITISWWMFVVAGIVTVLIALITVSFQAIKAAVTNPVKSLRTE
ncbi:MAG TPA: ABC transporter permease [Chitinophagaceae bacterium]|nr:ABC transporter permease [Chitinophagaceae bacterium]